MRSATETSAECHPRAVRLGQRRQQRHGREQCEHAEGDEHRPTPDAVGECAHQRLHQHEQEQRRRRDGRGVGLRQTDGVRQELLDVRREDVEVERAARGQADDDQHFARVLQQQPHFAGATAAGTMFLERLRLGQIASQIQAAERRRCADHERNAPAPGFELVVAEEHPLQHEQHRERQQLTHDERDVQDAGIEPALVRRRDLAHVRGARAVLAADAEALQKPREYQRGRRRSPAVAYAGANAINSEPRHISITDSVSAALRPLRSA